MKLNTIHQMLDVVRFNANETHIEKLKITRKEHNEEHV